MEGAKSAATAHQQRTNYLGGGRGGATTPVTVMAMLVIPDEDSKVEERIFNSRRYDEALKDYRRVLHACENPQAGGADGGRRQIWAQVWARAVDKSG